MSINISTQNIYGKCDLKCAYNFKYSNSNSVAKNNGIQISLTYENTNEPPVIYNNNKYTVSTINIVSSSLHLFNNTNTPAEIIIEHIPTTGGQSLFVCIPIIQSSETSIATSLITDIITNVSINAPSDGESTNLNLTDFSLQNIIPKKPFFNYLDNSSNSDYIVFGINSAISLTQNTLTTLNNIITPYALTSQGTHLFFNSLGPNQDLIGEGIYISCQPTGSSEENTDVINTKNLVTGLDLYSLKNNSIIILIIKIIVACIIFILIFVCIQYSYNFAIGEPLSKSNSHYSYKKASDIM